MTKMPHVDLNAWTVYYQDNPIISFKQSEVKPILFADSLEIILSGQMTEIQESASQREKLIQDFNRAMENKTR